MNPDRVWTTLSGADRVDDQKGPVTREGLGQRRIDDPHRVGDPDRVGDQRGPVTREGL